MSSKSWTLSPAYDLNPTIKRRQSLLINDQTDASDLSVLRKSAPQYFLTQGRADKIIEEVLLAVRGWKTIANRLALPERDQAIFANRFIQG